MPTREMLRMAQRLSAAYEQWLPVPARRRRSAWERWEQFFWDLRRTWLRSEKARIHGWLLAAAKLKRELTIALKAFNALTSEFRECLEGPPLSPTLKDLSVELQQLFGEFDQVTVDGRRRAIDVQTGAIILDGVELGSYLIRLHAVRLGDRADAECFEIVALEPNPARGEESVTHPHVRRRLLCAGAATLPLQLALEQGRLVDAFFLVRAVLETYNADSAHLRLTEWKVTSCWSCGASTNADERYFCESCEKEACFDCTSSCRRCGGVRCSSCQTHCDVCRAPFCQRCLKTSACSELKCCAACRGRCAKCNLAVAASELDTATSRCQACRDNSSEATLPY